MKIYFAGGENRGSSDALDQAGATRRLISYFYLKGVRNLHPEMFKGDIFLDSGAYTAFTQGAVISIDTYVKFIKQFQKELTVYANLDAIGDAEQSRHNYEQMIEAGVTPVPVFHQGEDFSYLHDYLKQADYLALGGMVGTTPKGLDPWLSACFGIIKDYWPKKIHGFGLTSSWLLEKYPFYSVDSTTWLNSAKFGFYSHFANRNVRQRTDEVGKRRKQLFPTQKKLLETVRSYLKLEKYVTDLWKARGIDWEVL